MSSSLRLAIAAIFKNEAPYILEWIAYHRVIGIDRFYIADNDSDDGSGEILGALHDANIITRLVFPRVAGMAPQLPAYREIMRRHSSEADWTAFIDADEFLLPTDGETSLRSLMCEIDAFDGVGGIGVNWAIYGSSGHVDAAPDDLVIERFSKRAEKKCGVNAHYKTILRNRAWAGTSDTPHTFVLASGFHQINTAADAIEQHPNLGDGLSASIVWDRLRLNHYVVKSKNEFLDRKRRRGRATKNGERRIESFFDDHDRNEVIDPMPHWLIEATRTELKRLKRVIGDAVITPTASPINVSATSALVPIEQCKLRPIKGAIDKIEIDAERLMVSVRGWALTENGQRVTYLAPTLDSFLLHKMSFKRMERPDVVRQIPSSVPDCGYQIEFSLADVPVDALASHQILIVGGGASDQIKFQIGNMGRPWPKAEAQNAITRLIGDSLNANPAINDSPEMPKASVEYLAAAMQKSRCYLEYGTGGSTVLAARTGVPTIVAVESDFSWRNAVQRKIDMMFGRADTKKYILHSNIGPTKELGYPKTDEHWARYHNYPLEAWRLCREKKLSPDLVLIDGRFRVACCLASFLFAAPGARILFDDYLDRPYYFSVENFVKRSHTIDRVAEFVVPDELPRDDVWLALMSAVTDPR